ncbi:hypothetical protein [Thiolapillus sp.]|uniref:hypothetical protein n=3 Tax=Thiolapillus sp. TaxID=2017437 RepID=UPI0025DBFDEE|nr:hypothetical protein [Thiolapillus sp.]
MIDFGTSQSPKSTRPLTTYLCPSRPGHQALRNNFASSLLLRTWLPYDWTPRSEAYFVFPLAQGTPGKQCGLAATGVYQPSLRSPWLAAMENMLSMLVESLFRGQGKLVTWSATSGFDDEEDTVSDPLRALSRISAEAGNCIYLLKDLPLWFDEQPALVRGLRDLYYRLLGRQIYVFVSHPVLKMPEALKKEMFLVEMALPSEEDILTQLHKHGGQGTVSDEDMLYHMAVAMTSVSSAS